MNIIFCYYAVNTFSFHALISNKPTPSAPQASAGKKKRDLFLCSSNLVSRAAESQYIMRTMFFFFLIRNVQAGYIYRY